MKKNALILFAFIFCSMFFTSSAQVMNNLVGTWMYSVEQTAPEYSKGTLVFEEGENAEYTGKIVFDSGQVITMSSVSLEADTVTFKAYVEGGVVTTVCTIDGDEMSGNVSTPDGILPFSATKGE